ncbi:MAG: hypothetical protein U9R25_02685 [Chloroflexota bacterium]|nr:hypothetical protein [Chloroflexota bacterium]
MKSKPEAKVSIELPDAATATSFSLEEIEELTVCPNCGREDALVILTDFIACAACGHSSAGVRGCT